MSGRFIRLACQSCGGKLDVYDDMERFACGYCGTEMVVHRRGGTVALKAVTEAIKQVQIGTDKTAAELAIARYESELKELRERDVEMSKKSANSCTALGCGGLVFVFGLVLVANETGSGFGWLLVYGGAAAGFAVFMGRRSNETKLQSNQARMRRLEVQIAEKKRIADG